MNDDKQEAPEGEVTAAENAVEGATGKRSAAANRNIWMGTAVGIGSAAIVAALLYSKRRK